MLATFVAISPQIARVLTVVATASVAGRYGTVWRRYRAAGGRNRSGFLLVFTGLLVCVSAGAALAFSARLPWTPATWVYPVELALMVYAHFTVPLADDLIRKENP